MVSFAARRVGEESVKSCARLMQVGRVPIYNHTKRLHVYAHSMQQSLLIIKSRAGIPPRDPFDIAAKSPLIPLNPGELFVSI